jgi:Uma2 family endonuclease
MASSTGIQIALPPAQGLELSLTRRLSQAEFETFCAENPDLRVEREADGKILIMPPVHLDSGFFEGELFGELRNFSKRDGRGQAFSPSTGFRLPDGSTRSPDASWVSYEQLDKLSPAERKSFASVVPEFVAEIRSDSDHLAHLKRKMAEVWIANGVQLAWLIDPTEKKSYVYHPDGSIEVVEGFETSLTGDPVLPGFVFDLRLLSGH